MKKQTAALTNQFHTIFFEFENLCNEEALLIYYRYEGQESKYRGRSRKINKDKKGLFFIHNKQKVRLEEV